MDFRKRRFTINKVFNKITKSEDFREKTMRLKQLKYLTGKQNCQ